jgi:hypothetical protein
MTERVFTENLSENWTHQREALLKKKFAEFGLKLEGTRLQTIVDELYRELESAGINFRPPVYLADEWGCPEATPIIGIPFYLADEKLMRLEDEIMEGIEAESDEDILSYLRHEAGHAFNYAYKLYVTEEWHKLFGPYSRPYRENYKPNPFSRNFVRHLPGWYAQKHPDEDFAETFAVWLNPSSNWQEVYKDWGCYQKLEYVDRMARQLGTQQPLVTADDYDTSIDLAGSIEEHYEEFKPEFVEMPPYFDGDLKDIFERDNRAAKEKNWIPAHQFLGEHSRQIVANINYWTGLNDALVRSLIRHFIERSKELKLWSDPAKKLRTLTEFTAYATTLCMNKLYKGDFIIK